MLFTKAALIFSTLTVLVAAQDAKANSKGLAAGHGRTPNASSSNRLMSKRDLSKRCTGSCAECFGAGYTLCPSSDIYCYLPGDSDYGLDSCSSNYGSDSTPTTTAGASAPTSSSSSGTDDICSQTGATCQSCFGPTYIDCPDGYHCYDPNDPQYDTCPDNSSSGSSGSGSSSGNTTISSCVASWGDGNIPCGSDGCYNPDAGESCCAGGYYCETGYTCSSTLGKCSYGSSGSGLGSSTSSFNNNLLATASSTAFNVFATSTSGNNLAAATTPGLTSSATGISQTSGESAGSVIAVGGMGTMIAAGLAVGVGMLML